MIYTPFLNSEKPSQIQDTRVRVQMSILLVKLTQTLFLKYENKNTMKEMY